MGSRAPGHFPPNHQRGPSGRHVTVRDCGCHDATVMHPPTPPPDLKLPGKHVLKERRRAGGGGGGGTQKLGDPKRPKKINFSKGSGFSLSQIWVQGGGGGYAIKAE